MGRGRSRIFTEAGFSMGWYHNACVDSIHTDIEQFDKNPSSESTGWFGPFRTWGEARKDAIAYHRCDLVRARGAVKELNNTRCK